MRARANDLRGIVNGIDYDEWNPETDPVDRKELTMRKHFVRKK